MGKKIKHKVAHVKGPAADEHHKAGSYRHMQGTPQAPSDHKATQKKNATQEHNGTDLGPNAAQPGDAGTGGYGSPQTMQGPMDYPGQEIGA